MGTDISTSIEIGFVFKTEVVSDLFAVNREEVSKVEDRYDPKTGEKTKPKKVIVEHGGLSHWVVLGKKIEEDDEVDEYDCGGGYTAYCALFDEIARVCKCRFSEFGSPNLGKTLVIFHPVDHEHDEERAIDCGNTCIGGSIPFDQVDASKLREIKRRLSDLDLEPGDAEIAQCWVIC